MRRTFTLTGFLWAILGCASAWAQSTPGFGSVQGVVVDAYGEGIPDTKVILTNAKMGMERTFMTSDDGVFDISGLAPAEGYSLKLSRTGFASWETGTFEVPLGEGVDFRIPLSPQAPATHVEAGSVRPMADTTKIGVNVLVPRRQLDALPYGNLRWGALTVLAPWMGAFNPIFESESSPPYLLIDGGKVSNSFNPGTAAPDRISQDVVQAVDVLSNGYPAAFPSAFGGIEDVATRSGGAGYHGDAYDFFRDGSLAAADRYAAGFKPAEHQHQGGLTVGGPIFRNKWFFFLNYEALDGRNEGFNRITNPLIADPTGSFVLLSNCKATATQCASAAKFIQSRMNVIVPRTEHSGVAFAKFDYHKSDRHTFSFEANGSKWVSPNGAQNQAVATDGSLLGNNGNIREDTRYLRASWVGTPHATTVNEMRASWTRDDLTGTPNAQLWPASTGPLSIDIAGTQIGAASGYPFTYPDERRREFSDSFSKAFNTHVTQFGVDLCYIEDSLNRIFSNGQYDYTSLTAFAQDFSGITVGRKAYTTYGQQFGNPIRTERTVDFGSYFQDTWRFFSRLTLIYGARYEKQLLPSPTSYNPTYENTINIPSPNIDGGPRLALAYNSDARTVFRASYDWFFAPYAGQALDALFIGSNQNLGTVLVTSAQTGAPIFPTSYSSALSIPSGVASPEFGNIKLRDPRSEQLTASMEKIVSKDTTFTLSLLGTRGIRLWNLYDLNFAPPVNTVTYTIDNAAGAPTSLYATPVWSGKSDLNSSHVYEVDSTSKSTRGALTVQLRRRMWNSLDLQAVYTWSHSTDDAGYPVNGLAGLVTVPGDPVVDKGSSTTDQRHRGVVSWVWQPTVSAAVPSIARRLLNGWTLSGIATAATGMPQTEQVMVNGQQVSGSTMVYTNALNGSGGWDRVPFDQIATLRPAPMVVVNARLARTVRVGERAQAQLMFEGYNLANMQFDTSVNTIAYVASGGILKPAPGLGVGNASYGLVNGTNARSLQVALRIVF
jgi:hypothetical protein